MKVITFFSHCFIFKFLFFLATRRQLNTALTHHLIWQLPVYTLSRHRGTSVMIYDNLLNVGPIFTLLLPLFRSPPPPEPNISLHCVFIAFFVCAAGNRVDKLWARKPKQWSKGLHLAEEICRVWWKISVDLCSISSTMQPGICLLISSCVTPAQLTQKSSQFVAQHLMHSHFFPTSPSAVWWKLFFWSTTLTDHFWSLLPWTQLTFQTGILVFMWFRKKKGLSTLFIASGILCLFVCCVFPLLT